MKSFLTRDSSGRVPRRSSFRPKQCSAMPPNPVLKTPPFQPRRHTMRTHLILLLLLGLISGFKSHDATLFASAETIETTTRNLDADLGDSSLALSYSLSRRGLKGSGAKYNSLAAGDKFTVALLADGTLRLWGSAPEVPAELTGVTRIAAGSDFVLARLNDGTVRAFGENKEGQCDVPGWAWGVKDVAAGMAHSLVLFQDGRVRGWGRNVEGQTNVPASLGEARMIAAGKDHSIAMLMDGSVQGGFKGRSENAKRY